MANLTKEDIRSVIEIIKELYLEDMIPWICGYSGGKDSTAVVQLVWSPLFLTGLLRQRQIRFGSI